MRPTHLLQTGIQELQSIIYIGYQGAAGAYKHSILLASVAQLCTIISAYSIMLYFYIGARGPTSSSRASGAKVEAEVMAAQGAAGNSRPTGSLPQ